MPGAGVEIAQFLVLELVEFDIEFDILVVEIAVIDRDVVAGPMPHRSPVDRDLPQRQEFAGVLDMGEILHLEGDVMHLGLGAADEIHRVVVGVAAQEDEEILDPVGHPEAQHAAIEIRHRLGILHHIGDVPELERAGAETLMVGAQIFPFLEQLDGGALGVVEGQHLADARNRVAAQLAFDAVGRQFLGHVGDVRLGRDLERDPAQALVAPFLQSQRQEAGLARQIGAVLVPAAEHQPVDLGVIGERLVEIRRLERGMPDPSRRDHGFLRPFGCSGAKS